MWDWAHSHLTHYGHIQRDYHYPARPVCTYDLRIMPSFPFLCYAPRPARLINAPRITLSLHYSHILCTATVGHIICYRRVRERFGYEDGCSRLCCYASCSRCKGCERVFLKEATHTQKATLDIFDNTQGIKCYFTYILHLIWTYLLPTQFMFKLVTFTLSGRSADHAFFQHTLPRRAWYSFTMHSCW